MGYFITIAFWIFLSGCLLAKSLHMSDFRAVLLRKHVTCPEDSTFYAPRNVEKQCITTALDCVRREFNGTVNVECEDPKKYVDETVEFLELLIKDRSDNGQALTASSECACERWPESFWDFVGEVSSLLELEHIDSLNSPTPKMAI